jgi:hypothetical protein
LLVGTTELLGELVIQSRSDLYGAGGQHVPITQVVAAELQQMLSVLRGLPAGVVSLANRNRNGVGLCLLTPTGRLQGDERLLGLRLLGNLDQEQAALGVADDGVPVDVEAANGREDGLVDDVTMALDRRQRRREGPLPDSHLLVASLLGLNRDHDTSTLGIGEGGDVLGELRSRRGIREPVWLLLEVHP